MKSIEVTGKNVDDAIAKALQKLNVAKDEIEYEVIDEGSK
ncbi:Jag N-terminal domain-containing protein, partial [Clostridium paraputrificum]